jgi:uncharacterized RDD family membrane protein YckC
MNEVHFGGFWRRGMAFFIDQMIICFLLFLIGVLFIQAYFSLYIGEFSVMSFMTALWFTTLLINILYFSYFHGTSGQTPGKMIMDLKVVQLTGGKMTLGLGFLRWVGYIFSALFSGLGFIWIAFDRKKQGWHDKLAKTVVIRTINGDEAFPLA